MNEELINNFLNSLLSEGISQPRIRKYRSMLSTLTKFLGKDFNKVDKQDLVNLFADMESDKIRNGVKPYSYETKRDYKVVVKRFWRWLKDSEDYPEMVRWIKTGVNHKLQHIIRTKDVLTEDEVYRMVNCAVHIRDKAIISMLFETGSRIGEIQNLKVGDVVFDDSGYNFVTNGKTGDVYKRVVNYKAVEYLRRWIEESGKTSNSPLWTTLARSHTNEKPMDYSGFNHMLKDIAKIAKIDKRVNPHAFRHARITDLRVNKRVPDAIIEMFVGWKPGSDMFNVYQHAKSEDVDRAMNEAYGLKNDQDKKSMISQFGKALEDPDFRKKMIALLMSKGVKV